MKQDLVINKTAIDFTNDSIVVKKFINGVLGGRMLDCTGYEKNVLLAGQCVITDGNGVYKPMPVKGETYGAMPEGFHYAGVVYRSSSIKVPVSIMFRGIVNKKCAPYYFKDDFNVEGIILANDLDDADPYQDYKVISDASEVASKAGKDVVIPADVINDLTSTPYFRNVLVENAEVEKTITLKAEEKMTLDGVSLAGAKGASNGKIIYAASELELKNITAKEDATLYNAFEGYQSVSDPKYSGLKKLVAEKLNIDCPSITHNIINVYTPANGAEIIIRDSKFNLTVDNSNILRLANYMNAENVTVVFENVDWTYENGLTKNDWSWAGLVIFQPSAQDVALNGDLSKIATWTFKFKNCRYNGVKVTENNFGEHNQVAYFYNINKSGEVTAPEGVTMIFE